MKHDERLVEVVARILTACLLVNEDDQRDMPTRQIVENLLDAIAASGTHWVAPWELTPAMIDSLFDFERGYADETWALMRDAYIAEHKP